MGWEFGSGREEGSWGWGREGSLQRGDDVGLYPHCGDGYTNLYMS